MLFYSDAIYIFIFSYIKLSLYFKAITVYRNTTTTNNNNDDEKDDENLMLFSINLLF
jgi:hypothetical protein